MKKRMNCKNWDYNSLNWFRFWMPSISGHKINLHYNGNKLTNWWVFVDAWDYANRNAIHPDTGYK